MHDTRISDNRRRTICRLAFLLLCALPTMTTAYWIFHPQTAGGWQLAIQARLAVETSVASVECKGPYETILRGVRFTDPELGTLLEATQVRVIRGQTNQVIVESPVSISSSALTRLVDRIHESLIRAHAAERPWQIVLGKTTIVGQNPETGQTTASDQASLNQYAPSLVATSALIEIESMPEGTRATVQLLLEGDPTRTPVRLDLLRGAGEMIDFQEIRLVTSANFLPVWLVNDLVPDTRSLGRDCEFTGEVVMNPTPDENGNGINYNGQLTGFFRNVDLDQLVSPFGQSLTGICDVHVAQFEIADNKFHSMLAEVTCVRGTIGQGMLAAAQKHLGFQVTRAIEPEPEFNSMKFRCEYGGGQLSVHSPPDGVIAFAGSDTHNHSTPLISSNVAAPTPLTGLAGFLVNPEESTNWTYDERRAEFLQRFDVPPPVHVAEGM